MKKIKTCLAVFAALAFATLAAEVASSAGDKSAVAANNTAESESVECVPLVDTIEWATGENVIVVRIHLYQHADGSETTFVVGADGVKRPVVLVDPMEYRLLTERLDAVWESFHATPEGRRKLHGKVERAEIDEAKREKVEVHADGYRHVETLPQKRKGIEAKTKVGNENDSEQKRPGIFSDRQWQMRQRLSTLKKKPIKTVTVEHDAVTGADTVKEGAK